MAQSTRKQTVSLNFDWVTMLASQIVDFGATVGSKSEVKGEGKTSSPLKGLNFKFSRISKIFEAVKKHKFLSAAIAVFILLFVLAVMYLPSANKNLPLVSGASQTNFSPSEQTTVNKRFEIPIRSADGKTTGTNLAFTLTTVDKSNRILIQGKPATSRDTKTFIILNLDIQNSTDNQLTVKPVDLVRFIDPEGKSFAPDVHNNEVIVEPIAIKKTRVGFVVDENQTNFKFTLGEVNGPKETIEVSI